MLENLLDSSELTQEQQKVINSINKKFSFNKAKDLEKLHTLLFDFYCASNVEAVNECLDILTQIKFNGDFDLWTFIQPSYCLKFYLSDDKEYKKKVTNMFYEEVRSPFFSEEKHKVFLLKVQSNHVLASDIEGVNNHLGNINDEYFRRTNLLAKYMYILALGANGDISPESILLEINKNTERLRQLYKIINKID